jgi:hypothetical protein
MTARIYPFLSDNIKPQVSTVGSDICDASTFNSCFSSAGARVDHLHQLAVLNAIYQTSMPFDTTVYDVVYDGPSGNLLALSATQGYIANRLLLTPWTADASYTAINSTLASSMQGVPSVFVAGNKCLTYNGTWASTTMVRTATSMATRRVAYSNSDHQYIVVSDGYGLPLIQVSNDYGATWASGAEGNAQPLAGTALNSLVYVPDLWIGNGSYNAALGVTYLAGSPGFFCLIQGEGTTGVPGSALVTYYPTNITGNVGAAAITYDYSMGACLFAARGTNKLYYATDPLIGDWTSRTVSAATCITDVLAVGGVWLIINSASDLAPGTVMMSVDQGYTWQYTGLTDIDRMIVVDRRIAFTSEFGVYLSGVIKVVA